MAQERYREDRRARDKARREIEDWLVSAPPSQPRDGVGAEEIACVCGWRWWPPALPEGRCPICKRQLVSQSIEEAEVGNATTEGEAVE
jgi:hypothetical protein